MKKQFSHMDIVYCKQHRERLISFLQLKKNCPYKSRLACSKCILEHKTTDGFMDIVDVLNDPTVLMIQNVQPKDKYVLLNQFFNLLEKDAEQYICSFKEDILKQIEKLLNDLKEGIAKCNQFKAEISKVKDYLQQNEASECERFRQAFRDIMKVDNYHESEQWKQFEGTVQDFVLQFEDQQIKELNNSNDKLKQMVTVFFKEQLISDFKSSISQSVESLGQNLGMMELLSEFTSLCDTQYWLKLIQRIQNKDGWPKVTLFFKGSQHGMNAQAFWQKCSSKGPTIIICKSKNGYVFGGYSPCKWIPNGQYQTDDSKTSFLFSYTRKEIYPIVSVGHAIYGNNGYGPTFGGAHNLYIGADFQSGSSNTHASFYSNESYKIENASTHLMGAATPQLVEMEVFLIEQ